MADLTQTILTLQAKLLRPCPDQPRVEFDEERLAELAASLKELGQQVAIIVRPIVEETCAETHEIIDGERRWRAAQMAWGGAAQLRCEVRGAKDRDHQFLQSVVSNFGRQDHTSMESALACARICAMPEYRDLPVTRRMDRVGAIFARSGQWVANMLRLAGLPTSVQQSLADRSLSAQIALFLTAVKDPDDQERLAKTIVEKQLKPPMARNLIRDTIASTGHARGRKERPSDHNRMVFGHVQKIAQLSESMLNAPSRGMNEMLAKHPGARESLVQRLDAAISSLQELRDGIARPVKRSA